MTDADRRAAEAIARKLREGGDPDVTAVELVALIRGIGWRPTEARPLPAWKTPGPRGSHPATDEARRIRAEWEARPHPNRSREDAS